ncbi:MAG: histidine phosphotransferase family protein [Alphaproteobacteria bacterium]
MTMSLAPADNRAESLCAAAVEALCARLCHDLASPVGAVANGVELLQDVGGGDGEIIQLLAHAAGEASRRLAYFRLAFGIGGDRDSQRTAVDLRDVAAAWLESGRLTFAWPDAEQVADFDRVTAKLILNMIGVAAAVMPFGGTLEVHAAGGPAAEFSLAMGAERLVADGPVMLVATGAATGEATPETVQAHLAAVLAARLGGRLALRSGSGGLHHLVFQSEAPGT